MTSLSYTKSTISRTSIRTGGFDKMVRKQLKKMTISFLKYSPRKWRDNFYRARLNFQPLPEGITIELAQDQKDLDQAFLVLHDAYVKEGFSKPYDSRRRVTDYHILPSTSTVVAKFEGNVIGTVSVIRDGLLGMPVDKVVDLTSFRRQGLSMGEVSSLAIKPEYRGHSGTIMFYLFKYIVGYSLNHFGVDNFLIVVNPSRRALYESLLMFEPLKGAKLKSYQFANNAPGICMRLNLKTLDQTWGKAYRGLPAAKNLYRFFFEPLGQTETQQLRYPERPFYTAEDPVMTPEMMDYFFKQCADGLCAFSSEQIGVLKNIYREKGYDALWPETENPNWRNHRWDPRYDVDCTGRIKSNEYHSGNLRILNASSKGLKVIADRDLVAQSALPLHVAVGEHKTVEMIAQPRWQSGPVCGLQIVTAGDVWEQFIAYMETRRAPNTRPEKTFADLNVSRIDHSTEAAML